MNPGHDKVVLDMDMLYNTKERNAFCKEWREVNGEEGEDLYKYQQRRLMFRKKIIGPPGKFLSCYSGMLCLKYLLMCLIFTGYLIDIVRSYRNRIFCMARQEP